MLAIWIGDSAARDVSVFTGSLVILLITLACIGWIPARNARTLLLVGFTWVVLTIAYELALGHFRVPSFLGRDFSDFDLRHWKLLPVGLLFLMFSPLLAARLRGRTGESGRQAVRPRDVTSGRGVDHGSS